jgi:hypothetical protein
MPMNYTKTIRFFHQVSADFVFFIHLLLIFTVAFGWLIPGLFYTHLTLVVLTLLSELLWGYCLLTRLEFGIRKKLNPALLFDTSCIIHYVRKWKGLAPRIISSDKKSFLKKNGFLITLIVIGAASFFYKFWI